MTTAELETQVLLAGAMRGYQDSAWEGLYGRYSERLEHLASRLIGSRLAGSHDAADLVAETWGRVMPLVKDFKHRKKDAFFGLLATHARRIVAEWGRRGGEGRHRLEAGGRIPVEDVDRWVHHESPGVTTLVHRAEIPDRVVEAIEDPRMRRPYRRVLKAILIEGRTREEVAAEQHVSLDTLKKQYQRARQLLSEILGELES